MDGDAFFVAVEISKNPKLKGLPVVTGEEKGIVSALSYEAKAFGVVRGMPIFQIKKQFPNIIILPGDYKSYAKYSKMMFDIVRRYIDVVEEYSIDECFADLTGHDLPLKMSYEQIAEKIKREINEELNLSISLGIASTKVLAKLASKWQKPNGFTVIKNERINDFLDKTAIDKIWGIGTQTSIFLKRKGIKTALDFVNKNENWIQENLSKPYKILWYELKGISILKVDGEKRALYSSIQKTQSFHPHTNNIDFLLSELSKHVENACAKARYYNLVPKYISFFIKTKDFRYISYKIKLETPTNTPESIYAHIKYNFDKIYHKDFLYRTTGITIFDLVPDSHIQSDLFGFDDKVQKFKKIHSQIDKIQNKYGRRAIYLASAHNSLKIDKKGTEVDDLDIDLLFL